MTFLLSALSRKLIYFYQVWMVVRRSGTNGTKMTFERAKREVTKPVMLNWDVFLKKVVPTGIISALDIGLSNWSFMFITVSLYTMVKSSCILWILFFSLILGLEKPRWNLCLIVMCIAFGLFLFVFKSTQFNLEGFILVLLASFLGGARWTLSQVLCQKAELGLTNPVDTVYHLCPSMIIGLFPIFIGRETSFLVSSHTFNAVTIPDLLQSVTLICMGGLIAFFLSISEYLLLSYTSSLTLSISGILKELCTLLIATNVGNDVLTPTNWLGFLICIFGICIHVRNKYQGMVVGSGNGHDDKTSCRVVTDLSLSKRKTEEQQGLMAGSDDEDDDQMQRFTSHLDEDAPVGLQDRQKSFEQAIRGETEGFDAIHNGPKWPKNRN